MESSETTHFLDAARRMLEIASGPGVDLVWKLRRLASLVVTDFPRALFKLQTLDHEAMLRVVPEFVTPLLQGIVDRYRASLGPLDVRDARLPAGADSLIEAGMLSAEPITITDPQEIERYYATHFATADRERLGAAIRDDLHVREVLLVPVRPDELPFGVVSVSSTSPFGPIQTAYWRTVAAAVTAAYRASDTRLLESLRERAFAGSEVATIIVDASGNPLDLNRMATTTLGFDDRNAALRHLGNLRPCLPARTALADDSGTLSAFYLADAYGGEIACETQCEPFTDPDGRMLGAIVRLRPSADLDARSLRLTRRQREVARLIAEGLTTKEAATKLGLSIHTVNYHRAQIRDQLADDETGGDLRTRIRTYFLGGR